MMDYSKYKSNRLYGITCPCIIIDNGSTNIRAGLSDFDDRPLIELESCIGYPKDEYKNKEIKDLYLIGQKAEYYQKYLDKVNYPIKRGKIKGPNDWNNLEKIYTHLFENELAVDSREHNVIISEIPLNSNENREKMAEMMFETFTVNGLYIQNQAILSMYAAGKMTGMVVDLSDSCTHFLPIFDGYIVKDKVKYQKIGGRDLTEFMKKLLIQENGHDFNIDYRIAKYIKEQICFVALDYSYEIKYLEAYEGEMPDGSLLKIKNARIQCPEILFNPELMEKNGENIAKICNDAITMDSDLMKEMYNNIVLTGGNSMFTGLPERFRREIESLAKGYMKEEVKVIADKDRYMFPYIGCNVLATDYNFDSICISRAEYEEKGFSIIHEKCPIL